MVVFSPRPLPDRLSAPNIIVQKRPQWQSMDTIDDVTTYYYLLLKERDRVISAEEQPLRM